jgi:anti-sigma regulatory factor (Ser/Thr protein kinase)
MSRPVSATAPNRFAHPAVFYRNAADYRAGLVPFIEDGLAAGEPVAVAVPGGNLALLRDALGPAGREVCWMDMTEQGRNPGRILPRMLLPFSDAHPDRPVRVIGEPVWPGRSALEYAACAQHEALINHAFTGRWATIVCPYNAARLDAVTLADAAATHPLLGDGPDWRPSDRYAPDTVLAEYNRPLAEPPAGHVDELFDVTTIPLARYVATEQANAAGLDSDRLGDVALVVTELVTNSIEHGGGTSRLRVWITPEHLVCEAADTGKLTDPLAGRRPAAPGQQRGFGLLLVNTLADLISTHTTPHGTTIRAHFRR